MCLKDSFMIKNALKTMSLVDDFPAKKGSNMHAFDAKFSSFCQIRV